ncbi:COX15 [Scenedesmus sp. PABB004]|nr:COX15 [Scenedesmus sp. PABB004]
MAQRQAAHRLLAGLRSGLAACQGAARDGAHLWQGSSGAAAQWQGAARRAAAQQLSSGAARPHAAAAWHGLAARRLLSTAAADAGAAGVAAAKAGAAAGQAALSPSLALSAGLPASARRQLVWWLGGCSAWVFSMVVLGGVTRLTRSGLSMTDWHFTGAAPHALVVSRRAPPAAPTSDRADRADRAARRAAAPASGERPPLTDAEWEAEFARYRSSPEFRLAHSHMGVEEFKFIYFMEWAHRMWGRVLGVAFAVPATYFAARGFINAPLGRRLGLCFAMGGAQGLVGWWMVRSGLEEPEGHAVPRVSPYRLAAHLTSAFGIFATLVWTTLDLARPEPLLASLSRTAAGAANTALAAAARAQAAGGAALRRRVLPLAALVGVTAVSGAFVAGLDAGRAYNTFPLMGGRLIPEEYWALSGLRNAFENTAAVQLHHRALALSTLAGVAGVWAGARRLSLPPPARAALHAVAALTAAQVTLGITTLLTYVPVSLGAAHQAGALTVFTAVLCLAHALRPAAPGAVGLAACAAAGDELSGAKQAHRAALAALSDELQGAKGQLCEVAAARDEARAQVESARGEVAALLASRERGGAALRAQVAQLQSALAAKSGEAAALSRRLAATTGLGDALEAELRGLAQSAAKLGGRLQAQEAGLRAHERRVLEVTTVGERLAEQLELKVAALQAAAAELEQLQAGRAAGEATQAALEARLAEAARELAVCREERSAAEAALREQLARSEAAAEAAEAAAAEQRAAATAQAGELGARLIAAQAAAAAGSQERNAAVVAVVALARARAALRAGARRAVAGAEAAASAAAQEAAAAVAAAAPTWAQPPEPAVLAAGSKRSHPDSGGGLAAQGGKQHQALPPWQQGGRQLQHGAPPPAAHQRCGGPQHRGQPPQHLPRPSHAAGHPGAAVPAVAALGMPRQQDRHQAAAPSGLFAAQTRGGAAAHQPQPAGGAQQQRAPVPARFVPASHAAAAFQAPPLQQHQVARAPAAGSVQEAHPATAAGPFGRGAARPPVPIPPPAPLAAEPAPPAAVAAPAAAAPAPAASCPPAPEVLGPGAQPVSAPQPPPATAQKRQQPPQARSGSAMGMLFSALADDSDGDSDSQDSNGGLLTTGC